MKGIKIAIKIFIVLSVLSALFSIAGFASYFYYGSSDMSADASGGGPVGLSYLLAMLAGGSVGIYSAILSGISAIIVVILMIICRKKSK